MYLDNPGGTQVHESVIAAMGEFFQNQNANLDGPFETSLAAEQMLVDARSAAAEFLGAESGGEIVFGANMTTLTMHASRTLLRDLGPGDEILLTGLDHDANVAPWLLAAEDRGVTVQQAGIDLDTCRVDMDDFAAKLSDRTRIAAFGWASNGAGTVSDVARMVELCHAAGAITYVDAVHFGPHGPIDVGALETDFLVCSAYKFFGPHVGILYGRREQLERHRPYKVRPSSPEPPSSWETGTVNLEGIAGTTAAIRYLQSIGMDAIAEYEAGFTRQLLDGLGAMPKVTLYGTRDLEWRVPTAVFNVEGRSAAEVSGLLAERGIFVWDGNYYAMELMQRLGIDDSGGAVRVGAVHYNTAAEIDFFLEAVASIT